MFELTYFGIKVVLTGIGEGDMLKILDFIDHFIELLLEGSIAFLKILVVLLVLDNEVFSLAQSHCYNFIVVFEHTDVLVVGLLLLQVVVEGCLLELLQSHLVFLARHLLFISKINICTVG